MHQINIVYLLHIILQLLQSTRVSFSFAKPDQPMLMESYFKSND
jgi:hypothetical protein